jgi:5-methylcytosine-specific restriction endonuclease McrA
MVFVLSKNKKPLMPCTEKRARLLLTKKKAVIHKMYPFTIRLKNRVHGELQPVRLKFDPGSKTSGIAIESKGKVLWLGNLNHKTTIKDDIRKRRDKRRRRRSANTRYRTPRFNNRKRHDGWLPPSLRANVESIVSISQKLKKLVPITDGSVETVRFDTQLLQNPEIRGIEYQRGALFGYEVKEYLLEKWGRKCAYCGKNNIPLEIEHIVPKSRGGTDRISNLTLTCNNCNTKKGNMTADEFGYPEVQKQALKPLTDAAVLNSTRKEIYRRLSQLFGFQIEVSSGGRTKYNKEKHGFPKTHYFDALCVGASTPEQFRNIEKILPIEITYRGRGQYQRTNIDGFGFPRGYLPRKKMHFGFQTGDMVKATIPKGKYTGKYTGTVAIRTNGYFDLKDVKGKRIVQGVNHKYLVPIHRFDGYSYSIRKENATSSP